MKIKNWKLKIVFIAIFIVGFLLFAANLVNAAELKALSPTQKIGISQQFQVDLILDTENEAINAIEGKIIFPQDLLEIKKINDGNSIINFWIDPVRSCVSNGVERPGSICFAGITPGGYQETKGFLFSVVFQARASGGDIIEIRDAKVLLNDGKGTSANLSISNFQFSISEEAPPLLPMVETVKDTDLPENFEPKIASDPNVFEGKYFLVFSAQDKKSGIDHYEVLENRKQKIENRRWVRTESPYVLKDQDLRSYIYVKAADKMGNERIAMLPPQKPLRWYENLIIWIIIILGVIVLYIIGKILWKKKLTR